MSTWAVPFSALFPASSIIWNKSLYDVDDLYVILYLKLMHLVKLTFSIEGESQG